MPDHVRNDLNAILSIQNKKSQVPKSHRFFNDFGIRFGILGTFSFKNPSKINPEIELEKKMPKNQKDPTLERSRLPQSTRIFSKIALFVENGSENGPG